MILFSGTALYAQDSLSRKTAALSDSIKTQSDTGNGQADVSKDVDSMYQSEILIPLTVDSADVDSLYHPKAFNEDSIGTDTTELDTTVVSDTAYVPDSSATSRVDSVKKEQSVRDEPGAGRKRKSDKKEEYLYPGISHDQDRMALQMIHEVYAFDWGEADRIGRRMQKLESRNNLPPLSYLLMVSMRIVRIQNSEFETDNEETVLLRETDSLVKMGLELSDQSEAHPGNKLTYLFINSGIQGFSATLKIAKRPIDAAFEGYDALKKLEKLAEKDTLNKDVYLGLGIFYCALAKAPAIVRGAINITGRDVSFEKGVGYLRISAYDGRYTTETAKQYLIQFLNPYLGHESAEKRRIFNSLEQLYPKNPFYLFHHIHENICFHPGTIDKEYVESVKKKISRFKSNNYSLQRYLVLLEYQYAYLDSLSENIPDSTIKLREFSFYPVFLDALREKKQTGLKKERYKRMHLTATGIRAAKLLDESAMSVNRKNFFTWYLRDALRE